MMKYLASNLLYSHLYRLEAIEKLDMKLEKLESLGSSTCSSRPSSSLEGRAVIPSVVLYLRSSFVRISIMKAFKNFKLILLHGFLVNQG